MDKVIAVASGGMDSAAMVYYLRDEGLDVEVISFDYGQRHKIELQYASRLYHRQLELRWDIVNISSMTEFISTSALTNPAIQVPEGHYAEETMKQTVVPNRNAIMMNIAIGIAVARKADYVATGVHAGDHAVYPDCRPAFIEKLEQLAIVANEGFISSRFSILAPFIFSSKRRIASIGDEFRLPWHLTWSCYKGDVIHCGRCSTCVERLEALEGFNDSTPYADTEYWRTVVGGETDDG